MKKLGYPFVLLLLSAGCANSPAAPAPVPKPTPRALPMPAATPPSPFQLVPYVPPEATPTPEATRSLRAEPVTRPGRVILSFDRWTNDLADPRQDGYNYPWLYAGNWFLNNGMLWHRDLRAQPNLSFRRYRGTTFGPDGALPPRYRAQVTEEFDESLPTFYPPTGDQGVPFYYQDPTHYVELLIKPTVFEVWECNGGEPEKWKGWRRLYAEDLSTGKGDRRTLGVEVDADRGSMDVFLDGQKRATVTSSLIAPGYRTVALRATGNSVGFENLSIESD